MLGFNFIFGLNFIFLCFKLIIIHHHTQKQRQIKKQHGEPQPSLRLSLLELVHVGISQGVHFRKVAVEKELAENLIIPNLLLVFEEIT